ncbi:MAG: hypothetical protein WHS77_10035 [Brevinematales bacterium]
MKSKYLCLLVLALTLFNCGEKRVKEEELKIIETKVISEKEPHTVAPEDIVVKNAVSTGVEESIIYMWYNVTNEIKELGDGNRETFWLITNLKDYLVFPVRGLEVPLTQLKRKDRLPFAIDILIGWAKDKETFKIYNRPKRVKLELYEVTGRAARSQYEESIPGPTFLVYSLVAELTDELGWHRLNIGMKESDFLDPDIGGRLAIEEVYPGISNYTAISEIRFVWRETNTNK